MKRQWLTKASMLILCVVLIVLGDSAWGIYTFGSNSEIVQADAAIVLGAATWGEQPSPVFRERINHTIEIYKSGDIRKIIFTGGSDGLNEPAEAIAAKRYAVGEGVLETDILTETRSRTTEENLFYGKQVAARHGLMRLLIVSDPLHMKRAMTMARALGMDAYPSPTPTSKYQSLASQIEFLTRETCFYLIYLLRHPFA